MTRKEFIKLSTLLITSPLYSSLINLEKKKMPSLFVGHGSPMNIIRNNGFTKSLSNITKTFDKPHAIVVVSAHWYEKGTFVSNSQEQETIYDFYGFPDALYDITYEPKGDPKLASSVANLIENSKEVDRGLDHGAWSVLKHMYPNEDIPTFQISMNKNFTYKQHFEIGRLLRKLREYGVLILGSGNCTHNLRLTRPRAVKFDTWALEFDKFVKDSFSNKNYSNIIKANLHPLFNIAHPYDDHYLPLVYTAGTINEFDKIEYFHEEIVSGNLSMRCIKIG
jgi:4,5-DOPA dioxygenase extradiol